MINVALDLVLLLACVSILALRFLGLRQPSSTAPSALPEHRTTLSIWITLGALMGGLIAGARLRVDLASPDAQTPIDGALLLATLGVVALAIGLWVFRNFRTKALR